MEIWIVYFIYFLILLIISIIIIHAIRFRRRAIILNVDLNHDENKIVVFVEKPVKYRIVNKKGKQKILISGHKELIPFNDNNVNPSHHKYWGLVLTKMGGNYFASDLDLSRRIFEIGEDYNKNTGKYDKKPQLKVEFKPIPYDLKSNFIETQEAINNRFTPSMTMLLTLGIVVLGIIGSFLMVYFTTKNIGPLTDQIGSLVDVLSKTLGPNIPH